MLDVDPTHEPPVWRFARFVELNDRVFGRGRWIMCSRPTCQDSFGRPSFHSAATHD